MTMKQKLNKFMGAVLALGLVSNLTNCDFSNGTKKVATPVQAEITEIPQQKKAVIPEFGEAEYERITLPRYSNLTDPAEISVLAMDTLYKIHAQNKDIDGLQSQNYSKIFSQSVIDTAGKRADETFLPRADALMSAVYDLAFLYGRITEQKLFQIKLDLIPRLSAIERAERKKYGKETDDTKEMLFRVSYMEEEQLHEIIALLQSTMPTAFPEEDRQYALQIASQLTNLAHYHGWQDGLKRQGTAPRLSPDFYYNLNADLSQHQHAQRPPMVAESIRSGN
jgi:hypothetical protein